MKRFIHEGTGGIWDQALDDPTKQAVFVAMHHGDVVYRRLFDNANFLNNYRKVYDGEFTNIYEYSPGSKLDLANLP